MPVVEGTLTADGATQSISNTGSYTVTLSGNFGGGTAQLEYKNQAGTFIPYATSDYTFTTSVEVRINERATKVIRVSLTGATSPSLFYSFGI